MVTLVRGGWVVAFDGERHRVIPDGEVAFDGARVVYAGPRWDGVPAHVVEAPGMLVSPGFINAHAHVGVELMAPFVDIPAGAPGRGRYSPSQAAAAEREPPPSLSPEEQQASGEFSLVQMLKCGTTTIVDAAGSGPLWWLGNPPGDEEMLLETAERVGVRLYASLSYRSGRVYYDRDGVARWHWDEDAGHEGLRRAVAFALAHRGTRGGLAEALLCPHAVDNCSPDLLRATRQASREHGLIVQIHCAQYEFEVLRVREQFGCTPVEHLARLGFLGPEIILGHTIYVQGHPLVGGDPDADLRLIAEAGASVAHSPLPFARRGELLHSFGRYRAAGITLAIGCDIWPADIIQEMRLAWVLGKAAARTPNSPTCQDVYDAATLGGARALGRPDLGRLAPGATADIVLIDLSRHHFGPVLDPIRALVTCATGQDVHSVWVQGRRVVEGGRVLAADEPRLRRAAEGVYRSLVRAARARDPVGAPPEILLGLDYVPPVLTA
ncbi:MAG: chlorohydrolase family protein [Armatimonadota bacterium]|nr:chlorohydrolase family protein [Armatimonadota bacterium]